MVKLCFFVPVSHVEQVKGALFNVGAGRIGHYDSCAWQVLGRGQFRPMPGSTPHLGEEGRLHVMDEYKVELVCEDHLAVQALVALKQAHPYEEPAYELHRLLAPEALV